MAGFIQHIRDGGISEASNKLGIEDLTGTPFADAATLLFDAFCPPGGGIDDSIPRRAWDQTLLEAVELGTLDFDHLTHDHWENLVKSFIVHSIETRIFEDVGNGIVPLALTVDEIDLVQDELHVLVSGAVGDMIGNQLSDNTGLSQEDLQDMTDGIYEQAFQYLAPSTEEA